MAWCRTGDKPLSETMMTQFNDAYMRHSASMSWYRPLIYIFNDWSYRVSYVKHGGLYLSHKHYELLNLVTLQNFFSQQYVSFVGWADIFFQRSWLSVRWVPKSKTYTDSPSFLSSPNNDLPNKVDEFSWMKMHEFRWRFNWSLFLSFQTTISLHWFR